MRKFWILLLALAAGCSSVNLPGPGGITGHDDYNPVYPVPVNNSSFLSDLTTFLGKEDAAERTEYGWGNSVVSGCLGATGASLTMTPSACTMYNANIRGTESGAITFSNNATTWVAADENTTGSNANLANFTRVSGTHYLIDSIDATQPAMASDSQLLMQVTTSGGAITAVVNKRTVGPSITGNVNGATSVKAYGAKGDKLTDDTANIQTALNAGTNITVPEGTYILSAALTPQSNSHIVCANRYTTTFKAAASNTTYNLFNIYNRNNITVENCGFNAQYPGWSNDPTNTTHVGNGFDILDSTHITIKHNFFTGGFHHAVASYGDSAANSVNQDLAVVDNEDLVTTPDFSFVNIIGQDGAIISRNTVWETIAHGTNNNLEMNNGLYIYYIPDGTNAQAVCRGISVTDNKFYGLDADSLETINIFCPGTIVKGNTVVGYANDNGSGTAGSDHAGIALQSTGPSSLSNVGPSDSIVEGNYVEKGYIRINALKGTLANAIVRNNTVKSAGCYAIYAIGAASQAINNLSIVGNSIDTVADFDTTQTCGVGIFVSGNQANTNFDISHNTILNTQKDSIWLRNPVTDATLQGNVITNPGVRSGYGGGINLNSASTANANLIAAGNVVYNVLGGTIGIDGGTSTNVLITDNTVNTIANGADGYHTSTNGTALVAQNTCVNNSGTCLALASGTAIDGVNAVNTGTAPTITAGCNGAGNSVTGTDYRGQIKTQTSGAATTCTMTFNHTWTVAPFCTFSDGNASTTPVAFSAGATTTTTAIVDFASATGTLIQYVCR